ncbi:phasin family protein [Sphingomonas faeni]|uniref:phasin family protein n=1 Tax=Sphingomonas faeni TaxID=185950 RepID=UPI003363462D
MADDVKTAADNAADQMKSAAATATEQMRDGAEQARSAFSEHVAEPAKRTGEAMKQSGEKIAEGGATIGKTIIDQAEQNAREAFNAMREAASAKDLTQVMKIQGDFLREQSQRSMSQAKEIGEMIMQFGRDAVAPLRGPGPR